MGELLALIGAVTFSASGLLIRYGQRERARDNGLFMTSLVNLGMYAVLTLGAWALGALPALTLAGFALFVLAGITNTLVGRWAWFQSMRAIGPSRSTALKATAPVFAAVLALVFLGQPLPPSTLAGIGLVVGGVLLLQAERRPKLAGSGHVAQGLGLGVLSSFSYGSGSVLRAAGLGFVPSPFLGALIGAVVAAASVLASDALRGTLGQRWADNLRDVPRAFVLAGILAGVAQLLQFAALQLTTVARATVIASAEPLMTTLLSAIFFSQLDSVTRRSAASVAGIVLGIAIVAAPRP
jgi:drug/metabolite transporter (DMT)-like permease